MEDNTLQNGSTKRKSLQSAQNQDNEQIHPDYLCGIGPFKPKWLQRFAHRNVYMVAYCILNMSQGMFYTYMISILSTIEKRFALPSKVTGFMMTGNEFSSIIAAIPIAYFGSKGHKPRLIAMGMYLSSLATLFMAMPEFVLPGNTALLESYKNSSFKDVCLVNGLHTENCQLEEEEDANSLAAVSILFIGLFVFGIGTLPMYSLGYSYIDDNVPKKKLPSYLGLSMGLRIIGPSAGYMLAGASLKTYHNPKIMPDFGPKDPRWVGAWWLGFIVVGGMISFTSCFMLLFPKVLALNGPKPKISETENLQRKCMKKLESTKILGVDSIKDLPKALKRVLSNTMLLAMTAEATLYLLGIVGFGTFMPKYLEAQFGQSASGASLVTGASTVSVMIVGLIGSGFIIQRFKPRPRILSGWALFLGCLHFVSLMIGMNISCEETITVHGNLTTDDLLNLNEDCNSYCQCSTEKFTPVCDKLNNITYFSACHAGCLHFNSSSKTYYDCSCLNTPDSSIELELGKCHTECNAFVIYVTLMTVMRFLLSTERIGGMLIFFRAIPSEDKSLALGWLNCILCLLAFLPCTILYGAVVDSTCIVWEESCNDRGNCWVYDVDSLRTWLHGLTGGLILTAQIFQFYVWYKCKDMKLYDEIIPEPEQPEAMPLQTKHQSKTEDNENTKHVNDG